MIDRRRWILGAAGLFVAAPTGAATGAFSLGVASGDPLPESVVLWTRLMDAGPGSISVTWEVAEDDQMRRVVKRGRTTADPQWAHSVHVEVTGLRPGRWYFYRFRAATAESPIGRTRTAPARGASVDGLNFAFASCQNYADGYYSAYEHLVKEDIELVVFLGDYIYEAAQREGTVRQHTGGELRTLADYRARYALYRSDLLLQEAHRLFPWIVVWDDHEVANDWAGDFPSWAQPDPQFLERRANAVQAFYEHMPLRRSSMPRGSTAQIYRRVDYGDLIRFHMLDTRQYRSRQTCNGGIEDCAERTDEGRSILGAAQERWLYDGLQASRARWNVLGNQVMMTAADMTPGPGESFAMDQWPGYERSRRALMEFIGSRNIPGVVTITGDHHHHMVAEMTLDSTPVGVELLGTSISSRGDGNPEDAFNRRAYAAMKENPHVKYYADRRGYVVCKVGREEWAADLRELDYVSIPGAPLSSAPGFRIERSRDRQGAGLVR